MDKSRAALAVLLLATAARCLRRELEEPGRAHAALGDVALALAKIELERAAIVARYAREGGSRRV